MTDIKLGASLMKLEANESNDCKRDEAAVPGGGGQPVALPHSLSSFHLSQL